MPRADYVSERIDEPVVAESYRTADDSTSVVPTPWSPAQLVGLIVGIGFAVLGVAALARTGFDTSHIYTPRVVVWRLPHTPLLAVIEIAFGALMIIASVVPGGLRTLMGLLGAVALVSGMVVLVGSTPDRLTHWLAVTDRSGWLFTISGAVVLVAAFAAPVFFGAPRRRLVR
jgi:hypothetical protein